jgi:DNA polymerase V
MSINFCLEELSSRVEEYSIDESFIWAGGIDNCMTFENGHQLGIMFPLLD